jgi:hypothetical protein
MIQAASAAPILNQATIKFKHEVMTFRSNTNFKKPADFATMMTYMLYVFPRNVELNILHTTLRDRS